MSGELRPVSPLRQVFLLFTLTLLGYLLQVSLIPYFRVGGMTPNLLLCLIAIFTVAYGRLRTFWAACIFGILMEIMVPSVNFVSLALYPVAALFLSFLFADKTRQDAGREQNAFTLFLQKPWVRTILCGICNALLHETVHVAYIYLGGTNLTSLHILRSLTSVLLTTLLTAILMGPLRRLILPRVKEKPRRKESFHGNESAEES